MAEDRNARERDFFNLNDVSQGLQRQLADGMAARIFVGDHAMLSIVTIAPHAQGEAHSHAEEQWGVLLEGDGIRKQGGVEYVVRSGDFWRTPGGVIHSFKAGDRGAKVLDIFSPPRDAYRKAGKGFTDR